MVKLNGETSDTNDNVKAKINTKHMKLVNDVTLGEHVNVRMVLLVLFSLESSHSFLHTHRVAQDVRVFVSSHPCMK